MEKNFVIVSGADSSHCQSLTNFLCSLFIHIPNARVVVFDLGLTNMESERLRHRFKTADFRKFDYSKYPDYFNIKLKRGWFAWKPVVVADVMNEFKCCICWMDAGTLILSPLRKIRKILQLKGFYISYEERDYLGTRHDIQKWTHPKTLKFMNVSDELTDKPMAPASFIGINYDDAKVREMIGKWKEYALIKECIAPEGSNYSNHRQDQAVLAVLTHQYGYGHCISPRSGFKQHYDIDLKRKTRKKTGRNRMHQKPNKTG